MAEIKVRLTGDNADFKRSLAEASAESRLAAAEMKAQFSELSKHTAEVAGDTTGLGKIGSLLSGLASGPVLAFGTALVSAVGEGVKKAIELSNIVAKLGTQFGGPSMGKEMAEYIEKITTVGGGPTKEEMQRVAIMLGAGGMKAEEVKEWLPRVQRLSAGTLTPAEEWGEKIAGGSAGIMRGLEHTPAVRAAMQESGIQDPLKALAWTADTTYASALNAQLGAAGAPLELLKRQAGNIMERAGQVFIGGEWKPGGKATISDKPQDFAMERLYSELPIQYRGPQMFNYQGSGAFHPNIGIGPGGETPSFGLMMMQRTAEQMQQAAQELKEHATTSKQVQTKILEMFDVR